MDIILSQTSSFARQGAKAAPELELRPFDEVLWGRLETMEIDPPDATTRFHHRLKQYNKWTDEFATRVTKEYRRFLYLAARASHPVTPSDTVDQAWHLHLIYTRHYWEELCGKILGLQLHHEPSAGGAVESSKFEGQYEQTIESYRAAFGEAPPADIWPVRKPAKPGTLGRKFLIAGAPVVVGTAFALMAGNILLLIPVAIVGIIAYGHVATAAPNPGLSGVGCGAAGSGGHAAAGGSCGSSGVHAAVAGSCGSSGGHGGSGGCGSGGGGSCGGGGCGGGGG